MQIKKIMVVNKFLLCSYYMYMSLILYLNLDCVSLLTIMISFFFVGGIHALYVCYELCRYLHLICEFMWHVQWHISSAILFSFMSMENDNIYTNEVRKVNMAMSACLWHVIRNNLGDLFNINNCILATNTVHVWCAKFRKPQHQSAGPCMCEKISRS